MKSQLTTLLNRQQVEIRHKGAPVVDNLPKKHGQSIGKSFLLIGGQS